MDILGIVLLAVLVWQLILLVAGFSVGFLVVVLVSFVKSKIKHSAINWSSTLILGLAIGVLCAIVFYNTITSIDESLDQKHAEARKEFVSNIFSSYKFNSLYAAYNHYIIELAVPRDGAYKIVAVGQQNDKVIARLEQIVIPLKEGVNSIDVPVVERGDSTFPADFYIEIYNINKDYYFYNRKWGFVTNAGAIDLKEGIIFYSPYSSNVPDLCQYYGGYKNNLPCKQENGLRNAEK